MGFPPEVVSTRHNSNALSGSLPAQLLLRYFQLLADELVAGEEVLQTHQSTLMSRFQCLQLSRLQNTVTCSQIYHRSASSRSCNYNWQRADLADIHRTAWFACYVLFYAANWPSSLPEVWSGLCLYLGSRGWSRERSSHPQRDPICL